MDNKLMYDLFNYITSDETDDVDIELLKIALLAEQQALFKIINFVEIYIQFIVNVRSYDINGIDLQGRIVYIRQSIRKLFDRMHNFADRYRIKPLKLSALYFDAVLNC